MIKYTQKELKQAVKLGLAIDITTDDSIVNEHMTMVGYSVGVYGLNGALLKGDETGENYAICARSSNLFKHC